MADNYVVNYNINFNSQTAIQSIQNFQNAINTLTATSKKLNEFQKKLNGLTAKMPKMNISTADINRKLDVVIRKLEKIHRLAKTVPAVNSKGQIVNPKGSPVQGNKSRSGGGRTSGRASSNISYKLLGPTPLNVGGVIGVDFLKGMGIAYGIAGAGTLVRNVINDSAEYNNLMQTAKNILKTHDKGANFGGRFAQMEQIIRNVGVETKFTAPQVADAAKFLAMAGFNIDAINKSIRPIADIALIGDTELGETADVVTNIMTGYGISPGQVRKATDVMTMTFTKSNTTLMEIAEAYKYSASLLSAAGIDFEESTAAIGILGDAGIKGSQAGTTMRTIMANIVNPTKKQLAQWEKIGVSRTDENGRARDLVDIFKDLSQAGLYVDDFYKLFHKTAAQGAVSLANNVEKWNEIIADNFLSDGLAKRLADEKKNTIQGLWAQLTSAFTEAGMKAFESVQHPIKDGMKTMTEWLKEKSTVNKFKEVARDLMDLAYGLKDITQMFMKWAGEWKGVIKSFVQFQIRIMPVLAVFKILKSGWHVVEGVGKTIVKINALSHAFHGLGVNLRHATIRGENWKTSIATFLTGRSVTDPKVAARYLQRHGWASFGTSLGTVLSTAGGAFAGNQISKALGVESETGKLLSTILGGGAGLLATMIGGPVGWAIGGSTLVLGLAATFANIAKKAKEARESCEEFAKATRMVDGVLSGENLSITERYWEIIYNKQLSVTEVVKKRVELLKEELGLSDMKKTSADSIDGKVALKTIEKITSTDQWWEVNSPTMARHAAMQAPDKVGQSQSGAWYWRDANGKTHTINDPKGPANAVDAMTALVALYKEGLEGNMTKQVKDEFANKLSKTLLTNDGLESIKALRDDWYERYGIIRYDQNTHPSSFAYSPEDVKSWIDTNNTEKLGASYSLGQGMYDSMVNQLGPQAPVWQAAEQYFTSLDANTLTQSEALDYITLMDKKIGAALFGYNPKGKSADQAVKEWYKFLHYYDGEWHPFNGNSAHLMAEEAYGLMDYTLSVVGGLPEQTRTALSVLTDAATKLRNIAGNYITSTGNSTNKVNSAKDGDTVEVNGNTYTWSEYEQMWIPDNLVLQKVSAQTMNSMRASEDRLTPDPSDYSTDYKSTSAAPKQIIVKIENLMNVESIDMTNPDNVAVVTDIKDQLAQALVDVVSDFTNNLGN